MLSKLGSLLLSYNNYLAGAGAGTGEGVANATNIDDV